MAWKTNNHSEKTFSEINITPLTDVMLVLLVIFMVTTPLLMMESFKIKLPKAATSDAETGKGLVVSVSEAGLISLNGKETALSELYGSIKKEIDKSPDKTVIIKADGRTMHAVIVKVLDTAKQAGAAKLSIATEHEGVRAR